MQPLKCDLVGCSAPLDLGTFHLIRAGKIHRFCSHEHRQSFRRSHLNEHIREQLFLPKPAHVTDHPAQAEDGVWR
jgi:hypothetical protein